MTFKAIEDANYLNHSISPTTLSFHLRRMSKSGDLKNNTGDWKSGKTSPYSLAPKTMQALRLRLYEPVVLTGTKRGMWSSKIKAKDKALRDILFIL